MQRIRRLAVNTANEARVVSPPLATTTFAALLTVQGRHIAFAAAIKNLLRVCLLFSRFCCKTLIEAIAGP